MIQFFKGKKENYVEASHGNGIYFATDVAELHAAGHWIGGGSGSDSGIAELAFDASTHALDVTYTDGSTKQIVLPLASTDSYGFMSAADKVKLDAFKLAWLEPLEDRTDSDRLVWKVDLDAILEDYAKSDDVTAEIAAAVADKVTLADVSTAIEEKLAGDEGDAYQKKSDVETAISDALANDGDAYQTASEVAAKIAEDTSIFIKSADISTFLSNSDVSLYKDPDNDLHYILEGKDGVQLGEINIPKDQFLKDAKFYKDASAAEADGKTDYGTTEFPALRFEFSTESGDVVSWISVKDLVDVYTAGDHVQIDNNVISVVDMSTNVTKTTEAITIAGGPLDSSAARALYPNGVIPAGTDMQALLTALFCKVIDGTVSASYLWNPVMNKPTVTLEGDGGVVEIGKSLSRNTALNNTGSGNTAKVTVTATQGYFKDDDTAYHSGNYVENVNGTFDFSENDLTTKWNNGSILPGESTVLANLGQNTLEVSQSGATASVGEFAAATIYASTNTKNKLDASVSVDVDKYSATSPKSLAATSVTKTVTGVYPVFYGLNTAPTKAALADSTTFKDLQIVESGEDRASFSYPAGRTISVSVLNTLNNTYEPYAGEFAITDETRTINGDDYNYKLWKRVAGGNNGSNKYQITLSKKTSVE